MERVSVTREINAPPAAVEEAMANVGEFMGAAGFTDATVDGDCVDIENRVGLATMTLSHASCSFSTRVDSARNVADSVNTTAPAAATS